LKNSEPAPKVIKKTNDRPVGKELDDWMIDAIDQYIADGNIYRSDSSDDEEIGHVLNAKPNRLPQEPSQHV
jgi:hypothetical protein